VLASCGASATSRSATRSAATSSTSWRCSGSAALVAPDGDRGAAHGADLRHPGDDRGGRRLPARSSSPATASRAGRAALFLAYYAAYTGYLVLASSEHAGLPVLSAALLWFALPLTAVTLAVLAWRAARAG
jgi:hypothetical protein